MNKLKKLKVTKVLELWQELFLRLRDDGVNVRDRVGVAAAGAVAADVGPRRGEGEGDGEGEGGVRRPQDRLLREDRTALRRQVRASKI